MVTKHKLKHNNKIKESRSDKIYSACCYAYLSLALILVFIPLLYIVMASFSAPDAVTSGQVFLWPVRPTLMAYEAVFSSSSIMTGFKNSFIYMILGTLINVSCTVALAYPLSIKTFYGKRFFMLMIVFTMYFSGGLIPTYLTVTNLGMYDTMWAILIPGAVSAYQVIVCRTFFMTSIPGELYDSAAIDGCGDLRSLFYIVLPNSQAILAVLTLMFAVQHWNAFFDAMIYFDDSAKFPIQLILKDILLDSSSADLLSGLDIESAMLKQQLAESLKYSTIVVSSLPMLIIYPFVQKYFIKGVMVGSLKG